MKFLRLATPSLVLVGFLGPIATAQTPPPAAGGGNPQPSAAASSAAPRANSANLSDPVSSRTRRRSAVHHYPYPYPDYYHGDNTAGFRNPGGVGRYAEYYPAGSKIGQQDGGHDPVRVAHFDQGGGAPDRDEQLRAQQLGVQKDSVMYRHIDSYARPYIGFGVGYFGGYN